jgi:Protein of unknown function (DUF2735)
MISNFPGSSNVSGAAKISTKVSTGISAKLYTFPPRGRFALTNESDGFEPAADSQLRRGVTVASSSAWYHDEAIKAERTGKN